jgi:ABC-2 type transport system permease protein
MLSTIWIRDLWRRRFALVAWMLALAAVAVIGTQLYPTLRDAPELGIRVSAFRPAAAALVGARTELDSREPADYLELELFGFVLPLAMVLFAIRMGAAGIAGEETAGTLDLLLANPISRGRVYREKLIALLSAVAVLGVTVWLVSWAAARAVALAIPPATLGATVLLLSLLALAHGALALAVGAATGRPAAAAAVTALVALIGYLVYTLSGVVPAIAPYVRLSPYFYYLGGDPLALGLDPLHAGALVAIAAIVTAVGFVAFRRRDILPPD